MFCELLYVFNNNYRLKPIESNNNINVACILSMRHIDWEIRHVRSKLLGGLFCHARIDVNTLLVSFRSGERHMFGLQHGRVALLWRLVCIMCNEISNIIS